MIKRVLGVALGLVIAAAAGFAEERITRVGDVPVPEVPEVKAKRANGVVTAEEWAAYYPEIAASLKMDEENTDRVKYTETDPDITILYDGMGFSFDYTSAIGHAYTLQDIAETTRPHKLANCLTCKTPDFTALVNQMGVSAYGIDFNEAYAMASESVTCYECHANTPGTLVLTHDYTRNAIGDEVAAGTIAAANAVCAQCHTEYVFAAPNKQTTVPWYDVASMSPDAILALENKVGYTDYTNENTGTKMIKVQHPEMETFLGEGSIHAGMFTCADCHMGVAYTEDGTAYVNHHLTSPLDNPQLLQDSCAQCHADLPAQVAAIQAHVTAREKDVSAKLVQLNAGLAELVAGGTKTEEELEAIRAVNRDAQFYWDFVYVENSEGAHNSKLSDYCLDKAEELCDKALQML